MVALLGTTAVVFAGVGAAVLAAGLAVVASVALAVVEAAGLTVVGASGARSPEQDPLVTGSHPGLTPVEFTVLTQEPFWGLESVH